MLNYWINHKIYYTLQILKSLIPLQAELLIFRRVTNITVTLDTMVLFGLQNTVETR